MLIRRTAELLAVVTDDGMEVSDEEREALKLAADYASGNQPETSFDARSTAWRTVQNDNQKVVKLYAAEFWRGSRRPIPGLRRSRGR